MFYFYILYLTIRLIKRVNVMRRARRPVVPTIKSPFASYCSRGLNSVSLVSLVVSVCVSTCAGHRSLCRPRFACVSRHRHRLPSFSPPTTVPTTNDCKCALMTLEDGTEQASGIVSGDWKQQGVSVGTMTVYQESDTVLRVDTMLSSESRLCRAYYDSSSVSSAKSFRSFLWLSVVSTIFNLASV